MNKIINYTLLFLLFLLTNCAYEPVLKNKNYQFSINIVKINGDKKTLILEFSSYNLIKSLFLD